MTYTLTTLATFTGTNGANPEGSLTADAAGNLYGTTYAGGANNAGTVFELPKTSGGYGAVTTLANFIRAIGTFPQGSLTADAAGNLYGTTDAGGANGDGTVFELPKTSGGYGALTTLASFTYVNGTYPQGSLTADSAGNLYGTTFGGGANGAGTVFELPKTSGGYGALATVATFTVGNGANPRGSLTADTAGNLYGTTQSGGANGDGTVFELPKTSGGYGAITTLANFNGGNGNAPLGSLTADTDRPPLGGPV